MNAPTAEVELTPPSISRYVLLVDDHAPSLDGLRRVLEGEGFVCVTSGSAMEAVGRCALHCPAVIVTDLNMPRMDGRGLARLARQHCPRTPIVLMTSECLDEAARASLDVAFAAVLSKPIDVAPLLRILRALVDGGPGAPDA